MRKPGERNRKARDEQRGYTDADVMEVGDNPERTDADFADARPFAEVFPEAERHRRSGVEDRKRRRPRSA